MASPRLGSLWVMGFEVRIFYFLWPGPPWAAARAGAGAGKKFEHLNELKF